MAIGHDLIRADLERLKRELASLEKMTLYIGVQGDAGSDMLMIARVHEYGLLLKMSDKMRRYLGAAGLFDSDDNYTPRPGSRQGYVNIPERSFIRASYDTGQRELQEYVNTAIAKVIDGRKTAREAMEEIGLRAAQMTQNFMGGATIPPQNTKFTLSRKGAQTPLIDSGRLVGSITYQIEGG